MGYECLLAGLPDLKAGAESPMTMQALLALFGETLSKEDMRLLDMLRMPSDAPEVLELIARNDEKYAEQECWWTDVRGTLSEIDLHMQALYELGLTSKNQFIRDWFAVVMVLTCAKQSLDITLWQKSCVRTCHRRILVCRQRWTT